MSSGTYLNFKNLEELYLCICLSPLLRGLSSHGQRLIEYIQFVNVEYANEYLKIDCIAMARWLNWMECHLVRQKILDSIIDLGTCLGYEGLIPLGAHVSAIDGYFSLTLMFLFL